MVRVRSWWPDMTEAAAWVVRAIVVSSLRIEADAARKPLGAPQHLRTVRTDRRPMRGVLSSRGSRSALSPS